LDEEAQSDEDAEREDPLAPVDRLGQRFKLPLEAAEVDVSKLCGEFYDMLLYATQVYFTGHT